MGQTIRELVMINYLIALGSSVGERELNIQNAVTRLAEYGIVTSLSNLLDTPPAGEVAQNRFLNAAAILSTDASPQHLMEGLLKIEKILGRVRGTKWEDRIIDLDIIMDDRQSKICKTNLILPHPLAHERIFVLKPSVEVAPHWIHPILQKSLANILDDLENSPTAPDRNIRLNEVSTFTNYPITSAERIFEN